MTEQNNRLPTDSINSRTLNSQTVRKLKLFYKTQDAIPKLLNIDDDSIPQQKLKDYYIKLENVFFDETGKKKEPIEIEQLFDQFMNQPQVKKVLIKGSAGMGKSTFLSFVSWKWGQQKLFNQKFTCTFRIPLKELANKSIFQNDFSELNILTTLIAYQLKKDATQIQVSQQQIKALLENQDKIMLLLDGYDEVSSCYGRHKFKYVKNFIDFVLSTDSKFHVLMTSRPNSIGEIETKFQRKIENLGLDLKDAKKYIDKFFKQGKQSPSKGQNLRETVKNSAQALKNLLSSNHKVRDVIKTPINLFMLCFVISQNQGVVQKFKGEFPLSKLYIQTLVWLTKRYKHKKDDRKETTKYLTSGDAFSRSQVKVLKKVAYKKFIENSQDIKSQDIMCVLQGNEKEEQLVKVYKFGLLKTVSSPNKNHKNSQEDDLHDKVFSFIHLSFMEFLAACELIDLLSADPKKISNFIAEHRNQPRYFMLLKFLIGIIHEQSQIEDIDNESLMSAKNRKLLKQAFWDSVICNFDGVLEFGLQSKVKLLMHLFGQCKAQNLKTDASQNLQKVRNFIDKEVIQNMDQWKEDIISSGYMSEQIYKHLMTMIDFQAGSKQVNSPTKRNSSIMLSSKKSITEQQTTLKLNDFQVASEIITSLINKDEFNKPEVISKLTTLDESQSQKNYFVLGNISVLIKSVQIYHKEEELMSSVVKLHKFLQNKTLHNLSFKILTNVILSQQNGSENPLNKIPFEALENIRQSTWKAILQGFKLQLSKKDSTTFQNYFKSMIKLSQISIKMAKSQNQQILQDKSKQMIDAMKTAFEKVVTQIKQLIPKDFIQILKVFPKSSSQILTTAKPFLSDGNLYVRRGTVELLGQLVKVKPALGKECIQFIKNFLSDSHIDQTLRLVLPQIATTIPKQALTIFQSLLKSDNNQTRQMAVCAFKKLPFLPPLQVNEIVANIKPLLFDKIVKVVLETMSVLGECAKAQSKIASQIIVTISLNSSYSDSTHFLIRNHMRKILFQILKQSSVKMDQLINSTKLILVETKSLELPLFILCQIFKQNPKQIVKLLGPFIQDSNDIVREIVAVAFGQFVNLQSSFASELIKKIHPLISEKQDKVRRAAKQSFKKMIKIMDFAQSYQTIKTLLKDPSHHGYFIQTGIESLTQIKQKIPNVQFTTTVIPFLSDTNYNVRQAVVSAIKCFIKETNIQQTEIDKFIQHLKIVITDKISITCRAQGASTLSQIATKYPNKIASIVPLIKTLFKDKQQTVKQSAAKSINTFLRQLPNEMQQFMVTQEVKQLLVFIKQCFNAKNSSLKNQALELSIKLLETRILDCLQLIDSIKQFATGYDSTLRNSATKYLFCMLKNYPQNGINVIKQLLPKVGNQQIKAFGKSFAQSFKVNSHLLSFIKKQTLLHINKDQERNARLLGISALSELCKIVPSQLAQNYELTVKLLEDSDIYIYQQGAKLFYGLIEKYNVNQAIKVFKLKIFASSFMFLNAFKQQVKEGLTVFFSTKTVPDEQASKIMSQILKIDNLFHYNNLFEILSHLPLQKIVIMELMRNEVYAFQVRQLCKKTLIKRLSDPVQSLKTSYKDIVALIQLSKYKQLKGYAKEIVLRISDEFKNSFIKVKGKQINILSSEINHQIESELQVEKKQQKLTDDKQTIEVSLEDKINWLNQRIVVQSSIEMNDQTDELKLDTENGLARMFLKKVFHNLLADGDVSQQDTQFLINCIKCNLTINVARDGRIIFQDNEYDLQIKQNPQARRQFERIVRAALQQKGELIDQYKSLKPCFPNQNSNKYLSLSASDIEKASSFIDPSKLASSCTIILSHIQSDNDEFCVVQKRNEFGDVMIYKIDSRAVRPFHITHPEINDINFRQKILGLLSENEYSTVSQSFPITIQKEIHQLIQNLVRNSLDSGQYESLCELIKEKHLKNKPQTIKPMWKLLGYEEHSKQVLNIKLHKLQARINSARIDEQISNINKRLQSAGVDDIALINETIEKFEEEQPKLGLYYKVFYWTLNSYIYCLKNSQTEMCKVNTNFGQQNSFMEEGVKKVGTYILKTLGEQTPVIKDFIGSLQKIIELIVQQVEKYKFQNKRNAITNIIKARINGNDQLCRVMQKTTIQIINKKRQKILFPQTQKEDSIVEDFFNTLEIGKDAIKSFLIQKRTKPYADGDIVAEMATKDVCHLISYMIKNWEKIVMDRQKKLEILLAEGFDEEDTRTAIKLGVNKAKAGGDCCVIY